MHISSIFNLSQFVDAAHCFFKVLVKVPSLKMISSCPIQILFYLPFPVFAQVSYVSVSTRETYSKVGRELLAVIATAHPHVISVLLERLRETIQIVGMVRSAFSKLQVISNH